VNTGISVNDNDISLDRQNAAPEIESLSSIEKDTLGEIGNICMGTCATTLSSMLGKRVVITTPQVTICTGNEYLQDYERPVVATEVLYTHGLDGNNVFLLKKEDALLITGLLMGGGQNEEEIEAMYLSATSEVMNQMVGSSSTALADILHVHVNISPPVTTEYKRADEIIATMFSNQVSIRISFRMEIEDLLVSNIMQIMPVKFGRKLAASLLSGETFTESNTYGEEPDMAKTESAVLSMNGLNEKRSVSEEKEKKPVELKTAKFQSFGDAKGTERLDKGQQQNIDLIIDVPLQVTVVLGKSKKSIKEILELGMGSVIVLDRLAGEMVDVLVNGKVFARGEVVVIDDNYGVRITEMMSGQIKM
jgi:flagellar motor switch protein FliN